MQEYLEAQLTGKVWETLEGFAAATRVALDFLDDIFPQTAPVVAAIVSTMDAVDAVVDELDTTPTAASVAAPRIARNKES